MPCGSKNSQTYCNPDDHGGEIEDAIPKKMKRKTREQRYRDDLPQTLDIDFTDDTMTDDEDDVLALGRNLLHHACLIRCSCHCWNRNKR